MKGSEKKVKEKILTYMSSNGLRITSQRRAIIDAAFNTSDHYTTEDLLARARKIDSSVSRATVYRTLPVLVKAGVLRELDLGKDYKYYDPNYATHPNHNHIICKDCDKIIEFEDYCLDVRESVIATSMGFKPEQVKLRIEGRCSELASHGHCTRSHTSKAKALSPDKES